MNLRIEDEPIVFVACRWAEEYEQVNSYIKNLIKRSGMRVSEAMDKAGVLPIHLKQTINIMDAHAFCAILIPVEKQVAPQQVVQEMTIAKNHKIPSFLFVDHLETGEPEVQGNLYGHLAELNAAGQWFEYRKEDLLTGKLDNKILGYLAAVKTFIQVEYPKIRAGLEAGLAVQWAAAIGAKPFQEGLHRIAEAYDKKQDLLYEAAAQAAAEITGAQFGFLGLGKPHDKSGEIEIDIRGFWGMSGVRKEAIRAHLRSAKLGYTLRDETFGLTGWVFKHGEVLREGHLQSDFQRLRQAGKNFVDPGDIGINSELCIPIKIKGQTVGILDVESQFENIFQPIHQTVLEWLGEVLAIAYIGEQLESFVGDLAKSADDSRDFPKKILRTLMNWSQADFGFYALADDESRCLVRAMLPENSVVDKQILNQLQKGEPIVISRDVGLAGRVLREGEPIYSPDPASEGEYAHWFPNIRSEIVLPIKSGERTIGIVDLEFHREQKFGGIDKRLFENLANLLAIPHWRPQAVLSSPRVE
jgi:putative methionine-R-sulfoxide reductase with GAF domain